MRSRVLERPGRLALGVGLAVVIVGILLAANHWWNRPAPLPVLPPVSFTDITEQAGIRFRHTNGAFGQKLLPETMGSGVAFLDFDNDGHQDLLFINSCHWPGHEPKNQPAPTPVLYRNLGDGTFEEMTGPAGLAVTLYGMGVAIGDFDNDGWPDLFITGVGGNRLFHNEPASAGANGRAFRDVTTAAGVGGSGEMPRPVDGEFVKWKRPINFSTSAAFFDYDGDGRLDLIVCNYVTWSPADDLRQGFTLVGGGRAYGPPRAFEGAQCVLYRNKGDGTFADVSRESGVQVHEKERPGSDGPSKPIAKALGVIVADVDEDGWPDFFVANDTVRNFFFHNVPGPNGTRVFEEVGQAAGVAYAEGVARGAMGADYAIDYRPGKHALLIGNFADEPNTFLSLDNNKRLQFSDMAQTEGVAGPSRSLLKFGVFFFDYDLDGRLDFLTTNGHLEPDIARAQQGQTYEQPVQLFWNTGQATRGFEQVSDRSVGPDLFRPLVGRGCAFADIDGNGTLDVVLTANGGPARLLRNDGGARNHWLRLRLEGDGKRSNKSAIGARVEVEAGGVVQRREIVSGRGYLSQSEFTLTFGLGKTTKVDKVTVRWPGRDASSPQVIHGLEVDQQHIIRQEP